MALNIPYSRPPSASPKTMLPKIPNAKIPKAPTAKKAKVPGVSLADQFTLKDPYAPGQIPTLAHSAFQADADNASRLAQMGQPTSASISADYAARGQQANAIQADLASRIAGIQQATVAQGNTGATQLASQNAAAQAGAPNIAGAPTAPGIPTNAVQAVLGSQNAAGGNYYGSLQAAALSSGAQANQKAIDAGAVAATDNTNNIQKQLASLLAGVPLESARVADMTKQNQTVDAANLQTRFSVYQGLQQAKSTAAALGNKTAEAAADRDLKKWETQQSNATKKALNIQNDTTKTTIAASGNRTKAQIAKDNNAARVTAAKTSAAAKVTAAKTAAAAKAKTTDASGKSYKSYKVTVTLPQTSAYDADTGKTKIVPPKRVVKTVPATVWSRFNSSGPTGKRKLKILGVPEGSKVESSTGY